jgi:tetratricopeptide (TPR) repeat protein
LTPLLDRQRERFLADPNDAQAFQSLEEELFLAGDWAGVIEVYERRLSADNVVDQPREQAAIHCRIGQVHHERLGDPENAIACYREALQIDSQYRPALTRLRKLHASQHQWDVAVQIGEVEAGLTMRPDERATLLAEMGTIWLEQLGDRSQAIEMFKRALEEHPTQIDALEGMARVFAAAGQMARAADAWDQVIELLRGPARAIALVARARLAEDSLKDVALAAELYRRALTDDPNNLAALEAVAGQAEADENWTLLVDLQERRFELTPEAEGKARIAMETGEIHWKRSSNPSAAQLWLDRATSLDPNNRKIVTALADLARDNGDDEALVQHLERIAELSRGPTPVSVLLELSTLYSDLGDTDRAYQNLALAFEFDPDNDLVGEAFSEILARLGRDEELVEILEQRASTPSMDDASRAMVFSDLGALWEGRLDDVDAACSAYQRAFEADPATSGVASALERLYRKTENWGSLRSFLEHAGGHALPDERTRYLCSLALLLNEQFDAPEQATQVLESVLAMEPDSVTALRGLQHLAASTGDEDTVLRAYEAEAAIALNEERIAFLVGELVPRLEARGEPEAALRWVDRWVEASPGDRQAFATSARLREQLGQDAPLVADLERLAELVTAEEKAEVHRRLGGLHADNGRPDESIAAYQAAVESEPDDEHTLEALSAQLWNAGRLEELAVAQRRLADLLPGPQRCAQLDELSSLLADRLGDLRGAIEVLRELTGEPDAPRDVYARLEILLERAGMFEALASHLEERVAGLDPYAPDARVLQLRRADVLLENLDRFSEAASAYRSVYDVDPESERARVGLEQALRAAGDPAGLAEFLGEQMESTSDTAIRDRCGFERAVLLEESLDRATEAIEVYRHLGESGIDPTFRRKASERLTILLERTEDWDGLRTHLEASLAEEPTEADLATVERLGKLYRDRLRNAPRAIDHLEVATTIAPERADLWQMLAELYLEEERFDDIVSALEAEIATGPGPDRELALRGRAAQLCVDPLDERDRAMEHYERVLELDSTHSRAADFLIDHYKRQGNIDGVVRLLVARLEALEQGSEGDSEESSLRISLRLQISGLRANPLNDVEGAIDALVPALAEIGPHPIIAEPLADLYQRADRSQDLIDLCRSAANACSDSSERAAWYVRLGAALSEIDQDEEAAVAYRDALTDRPDDCDAQAALREIYRRLGESEPLVRLLEVELSHLAGRDEIPVRVELAQLLGEMRERRHEALAHLQRILQIDPEQIDSLDHALEIAESLQQESADAASGAVLLDLLNTQLSRTQPATARADQLVRRARLLGNSLDRPDEAIADLREALMLEPDQPGALDPLRALLTAREQWEAVLDCVFRQASATEGPRRGGLYDEAVAIAWEHLGPDATLPWLERLRAERPNDHTILERIADVHRLAGRHEATLHALQSQISLINEPERLCRLHLERARIFEQKLELDGRAACALEDAKRIAPADPEILSNLSTLYEKLGRRREHAEILERCAANAAGDERIELLQRLAGLYGDSLAEPRRAAARLLTAITESTEGTPKHGELLRELGVALRNSHDPSSWASCAEEELKALDPEAPVFDDRRLELHRELARVYERELGCPDAALHHFRALADSSDHQHLQGESTKAKDNALLRLLEIQGNWIEFELRLTAHLKRESDDPEGWLRLGRLRAERLHLPAAAIAAYREVLKQDPLCAPALRALRSNLERLGRWAEVAQTLEHELEHGAPTVPSRRAALLRRLGDVCWSRLHSTTRASRSYAAALEADPQDFESLRSLQELLEAMEDWRGALDLYESEVEMLGDAAPDRRFEVLIRAAELARDHTDEVDRSIRDYEYAASIGGLPPAALHELALLYERVDNREAFAKTFELWCDNTESGASCADHVKLAETLDGLGHAGAARERIDHALEVDPTHRPAWDTAAQLRERAGDLMGAAAALCSAAERCDDHEGCARLIRAAELSESSSTAQAADRIRDALRRDSGAADAHAILARLACELGEFEEAESAATQTIDLASTANRLTSEQQLAAAVAGGQAARELDHPDVAARCFSVAYELSPEDPEILARYGEALAAQGDLSGAKAILEKRLEIEGSNPDRAAQLSMIGRAQWEAGEHEAAIDNLEAALQEDSHLDDAHRALVELWEAKENVDEGIACLVRWADIAAEHPQRAERLLRAAEWELRDGDRNESAEIHLRDVLDADPSQLRAWEALTTLLWESNRAEDALQVASMAVSGVDGANSSPVLSLIRGRVLEQLGEKEEAADAFRDAASADPDCVEAALSRARLLRGLGKWQAAADALREFHREHHGHDREGLSEVLQQLGRLLAGPLEDPDGAITAYRQGVILNPDRIEMHASLAEFLSHRPADWQEALTHYEQVLNDNPCHVGSLRTLLRVAREHGNREAAATGAGIAHALGIASPGDCEAFTEDAAVKPYYSGNGELSKPLWEKLRRMVNESASELATALDTSDPKVGETPNDPVAAFHAEALAAEGRLTASALLPVSTQELGDLVVLIAGLALDLEGAHGDGRVVNAVSTAIKRRLRRRLRRHLKDNSIEQIEQIDFEDWRSEVRALAAAVAIDETGIDLRTALIALARDASEHRTEEISEKADLTAWVAERPAANALLRQAIGSWLRQL